MARRTKEEALETREQLIDAAERVFRERGVGHASLAEVADAAGVARGAIYHHFASKAELFEAMLARAEMPIDAAFDAAQAPIDDPLAAVRDTALKALLHLTSSQRVQNIFEVAFLRCEYTDDLAPVEKRHLEERAQCLAFGKGLSIRPWDRVNCRLTPTRNSRRMRFTRSSAVRCATGYRRRSTFDLNAAAPQLVDIFIGGLRAAPPRKATAKPTG